MIIRLIEKVPQRTSFSWRSEWIPAMDRIFKDLPGFDGVRQVIASKQLCWKAQMSSLGEDRIVRERRRYVKTGPAWI
jgi:hypothetical protein